MHLLYNGLFLHTLAHAYLHGMQTLLGGVCKRQV